MTLSHSVSRRVLLRGLTVNLWAGSTILINDRLRLAYLKLKKCPKVINVRFGIQRLAGISHGRSVTWRWRFAASTCRRGVAWQLEAAVNLARCGKKPLGWQWQ